MSQTDTQSSAQQQSPESEQPRIGVYVCHCGGNISDVVDVEEVVRAVAGLPGVVVARRDMSMCSDPGQQLIVDDIRNSKLNRVVVGACSPSLHELTFRGALSRAGLNPYLYEHVNLREQVSWCSKSDPRGATEKAIRLVGVAVAKARLLHSLDPIRVDAKQHVLVIGGGISGLRAARDLARCGLAVTLLERSPFLGGRIAQLSHVYPSRDDARGLLRRILDEVMADPNITVRTGAEVVSSSGYVGNFQLQVRLHPRGVNGDLTSEQLQAVIEACPEAVQSEFDHGLVKRKAIYRPYPDSSPSAAAIDWTTCTRCGKCAEVVDGESITLDAEPEEITLDAGAVVMATGFDLYQPRSGEYGHGEFSNVITLPQLVRLMDETGPTGGQLQWNDRPIKNVCLIHCVGSRQMPGIHEPGPDGRLNEYCSRVCCTATLQTALEIRERFPEINVFEFYQDIRTYGRGHEEIYEDACRRGVTFLRYRAEEPPTVSGAEGEAAPSLAVRVKDTLTFGEELEIPADLVVLSVGMVPRDIAGLVETLKLPCSADGFLQEVHPKLRPVESAVEGVFLAGTCQAPMDMTEGCAAASATAAKAAALLGRGHLELDPFVARVDLDRCQGEGKCVDECEHRRAITMVETEVDGERVTRAEVNPALCNGCGMCAAVCPHRAIQVEGWRLDQYDSMIDALVADYPALEHANV
ncbi:MAG: CoB--CoM heterodisulfide reductase iron-sulfur subunit A family protein [Phycisphaerales bacterium]|nr:CoB--CoM heterodisulfide reductase iron-sulfur subunit A family protein [Phycisphaerales bacterium]